VVVPFIVAAPRFFSGALPLGGLMQTASAFGYVRDALTWFITAYVSFAGWKAAADRLTSFRDAIQSAREEQRSNTEIEVLDGTGTALELDLVELDRPTGVPLLTPAKLQVQPGSRILIQGPSGSGKSTLLRAIAGIWPFGRGVIRRPRGFEPLFLPQRPYFPLGTLREAMCYPTPCSLFADHEIKSVLESVGLAHLIVRLDESANWSQALSGADQQRVAFARALLQKPGWLFLDEATSNLDASSRTKLYQLLTDRLPQTTIVSIAGGEGLAKASKAFALTRTLHNTGSPRETCGRTISSSSLSARRCRLPMNTPPRASPSCIRPALLFRSGSTGGVGPAGKRNTTRAESIPCSKRGPTQRTSTALPSRWIKSR